ncbi:MAG: helix-turn-helix domain-containing protein [Bdellovibrionia bacterium]
MILDENRAYYEILDISPDASSQEVREAYVRVKATYNRDSLVLYTLVSPEEREETLKNIEAAYAVLSDREKRKDYDENHGIQGFLDNPFAHQQHETRGENIVSIDRVPPMEQSSEEADILIPPSTDFQEATSPQPPTFNPTGLTAKTPEPNPFSMPSSSSSNELPMIPEENQAIVYAQTQYHPREGERSRTRLTSYGTRSALPQIGAELAREIELEGEWQGPFLKKIREAYKISIEELSNTTKISKTYLHAIEADNFTKLPAPVYVRGFITQIAKVLKLVPERVVPVYMTRFKTTTNK